MRKSILIFFLLLLSSQLQANPDSLLLKLRTANSVEQRVDIYNALSAFYIHYDFQKCLEYGNTAFKMSKNSNYLKGEGMANLNLGWVYWINAYYNHALPLLNNAKKIFDKTGDLNNRAKSNRIIGLLYHYQVKEDSAIKYLETASQQFLEVGDTISHSITLSELSFSYAHIGDMEMSNQLAVESHAVKLNVQSIRSQYHTWFFAGHSRQAYQNEEIVKSVLSKKLDDFKLMRRQPIAYKFAKTASEIGDLFQIINNYDSSLWYHQISASVYDSLSSHLRLAYELVYQGECYFFKKEYDNSDPLFEQAYISYVKAGNYAGIGIPLDYLGKNALRKKQFKKALSYFEKALTLADSVGHGIDVLRFTRRLSDTYREMGDLDNAIKQASSAYNLARKIGAPNHIMWGAEKMYLAYERKNDYEQAYEFLKIHDQLALDFQKNLLNKESLQFQSVFELNEKTREVEFLNIENTNKQTEIDLQKSYLVSTIVGLFAIFGIALVFNYRVKRIRALNNKITYQNEELIVMNRDKEILLKEVHHRVKNNLQMIGSLINMQKRRIKEPDTELLFSYTQSRLKSIGLIHEYLYKTDTLSTIKLKPYLEELVGTILNSFQGKTKISTTYEIQEQEVNIDTAIPIGLMVNELITNSLKYAFSSNEDPQLTIMLNKTDSYFELIVRDNGPGGEINKDGFGWTIIESMVETLSGQIKVDGSKGLEVTITFQVGT